MRQPFEQLQIGLLRRRNGAIPQQACRDEMFEVLSYRLHNAVIAQLRERWRYPRRLTIGQGTTHEQKSSMPPSRRFPEKFTGGFGGTAKFVIEDEGADIA
jgi:hypothetical protein